MALKGYKLFGSTFDTIKKNIPKVARAYICLSSGDQGIVPLGSLSPLVCKEDSSLGTTVPDIYVVVLALIDAVLIALHLEDQPAISSLGSFRAPTTVETFPLHPLFKIFLYAD